MGGWQVPPQVEQALENTTTVIEGGKGRQLTNSSKRLITELRKNSRTSARGGDNPLVKLDSASGLRERRSRKVPALFSPTRFPDHPPTSVHAPSEKLFWYPLVGGHVLTVAITGDITPINIIGIHHGDSYCFDNGLAAVKMTALRQLLSRDHVMLP